MAIIKHGKIHGKIGNYIYRVINGVEVIQSYPRRSKLSANTKVENKRFGECAEMNSVIYQLIKDFALTAIDGKFYGEQMAFVKRTFFSGDALENQNIPGDWDLISGTRDWAINKKIGLNQIFRDSPLGEIHGDNCSIQIPDFKLKEEKEWKLPPNAKFIQFSFSLIHYDFETGLAHPVYEYNSERYAIHKGLEEQGFNISFVDFNRPVEKGLIFLCFGLRFYMYLESFGYLNTKDFNPCSVLGIWHK